MADQTLRAQPVRSSRARRTAFRLLVVSAIVLLLFGVPWWTLLVAGARWPTLVLVIGTLATRGILMKPLPIAVVAVLLALTVVFCLLLDLVKVRVFRRLQIV